MAKLSRAELASMGLALCDELSDRGAGWPGTVDQTSGTYKGDTFLDDIFSYFAPDMAIPDNDIPDAELAERLSYAAMYLQGLVSDGMLLAGDVEGVLGAVDLSPLNTPPPPAAPAPVELVSVTNLRYQPPLFP